MSIRVKLPLSARGYCLVTRGYCLGIRILQMASNWLSSHSSRAFIMFLNSILTSNDIDSSSVRLYSQSSFQSFFAGYAFVDSSYPLQQLDCCRAESIFVIKIRIDNIVGVIFDKSVYLIFK